MKDKDDQTMTTEEGIHTVRKVARNSFFLMLSKVLGMFINVAIIAMVTRYLGLELFGAFAIITAISMTLRPFADFGTDTIICREISKDSTHAGIYVSTNVITRIFLSLLIIIFVTLFLYFFSGWAGEMKLAVIVSLASELFVALGLLYLSVIRAFEKMEFELYSNTIRNMITMAFIGLAVLLNKGILGVFWAIFSASIFFMALSAYIVHHRFVRMSFGFDSRLMKYFFREAYPIAIFAILLTLIFKVDVFFLKWMSTDTAVALYDVPHRLIIRLQVLPISLTFALFPVMARAAMEKSQNSLSQYYRNAGKFLLVIGVPLAALMAIGGKPLIVFIFGRPFADAFLPLMILAPTVMFLFMVSMQNHLFISINRQHLNILTVSIALATNIFLDIILIPRYDYIGASIATLFSYILLFLLNHYYLFRNGISWRFQTTIFRLLLAGAIMFSAAFISLPSDLLTLVSRFFMAAAIYLLALYLFRTLSKEETENLKRIFVGRRRDRFPGDRPF